jgi:putative endonuclease
MTRRKTGTRSEAIAAAALTRAGYTILDRNWRCPAGELDLVAQHHGEIVFIEVRSRTDGPDTALESITVGKRKRLARLAYAYLAAHGLDSAAFRIDVVAVGLRSQSVEIIENAIGW